MHTLSDKSLLYSTEYYENGLTMAQIAEKYHVNKSTVCRTIKRADRRTCPFSISCGTCKLKECAIKDDYRYLVNNGDYDKRSTV